MIIDWFISTALAAPTDPTAAPATTAASTAATHPQTASHPLNSLFFVFALMIIMYFLLIWPQSKRAKQHRTMVASLSKGDEVVTTGGVVGKIAQIEENYIKLEIAPNVEIHIQKNSVGAVLPKGTLKNF